MFPGLLLICTLAFLLGLTLLTLALRGRRINDHPICRRCKFDLVGIYPGVKHCPECGVSLVGHTTPRKGRRRRSPRLVLSGAAMLALPTVATVWTLLPSAGQYTLARIEPRGLLQWELRHAPANAATGALAELQRRAGNGADPALLDAASDALLARHADTEIAWGPRLSDFLESRFAASALTTDEFRTYLDQMPCWSVTHPPRVHTGSSLDPWISGWMTADQHRAGSRSAYQIVPTLVGARIGGISQRLVPTDGGAVTPGHRSTFWPNGTVGVTSASGLQPQRIAAINAPPGDSTLESDWQIEIVDPRKGTIVAAWVRTITSPLTVVPRDEPLTKLLGPDPAIEQRLRKAIAIDRARWYPVHGGGQIISARFLAGVVPVDCYWRIVVVIDGVEIEPDPYDSGTCASSRASSGPQTYSFQCFLPKLHRSRTRPGQTSSSVRNPNWHPLRGSRDRSGAATWYSRMCRSTPSRIAELRVAKTTTPGPKDRGLKIASSWVPSFATRCRAAIRRPLPGVTRAVGDCDGRECAHVPVADRSARPRQ